MVYQLRPCLLKVGTDLLCKLLRVTDDEEAAGVNLQLFRDFLVHLIFEYCPFPQVVMLLQILKPSSSEATNFLFFLDLIELLGLFVSLLVVLILKSVLEDFLFQRD